MGWFKSEPTVVYKIVEIPPVENFEANREVKESVAALAFNPGFKYLLNRMAYVKAYLSRQLENPQNSRDTDVFLKAGIYWADFLKAEITKSQPQKPLALADEQEHQAFMAAQDAIEAVGI